MPRTPSPDPDAEGVEGATESLDGEVPSYEIPEVLRLENDRAILNRLLAEDPFEVRSRVPRRMRERGVLLPTTRLVTFTMARMAIAAKSYRGTTPIADWAELAVDVSIDDMLEEIHEEERRGLPVPDSEDYEFYAELAGLFGCPILDARVALVTLNGLPESQRLAFYRVMVQGMSVAAWAEEWGATQRQVSDLLRNVGDEVNRRLQKRRKARKRRRL